MSCPTCDGTLAALFQEGGRSWFHCWRCGTLVVMTLGSDVRDVHTPKLVDRCRRLERDIVTKADDDSLLLHWVRMGVAESINTPGDRPEGP